MKRKKSWRGGYGLMSGIEKIKAPDRRGQAVGLDDEGLLIQLGGGVPVITFFTR